MNKTLLFKDVEVNKKDFYSDKKAIPLKLVDVTNIVISNRVKNNNDAYNYYIGYLNGDDIKAFCILLPQMSGYIKYFENGSKNMSFKIEDEDVYLRYRAIWNRIKSMLNIKFHSEPVYDEKCIKTKVKTFNEMINTLFTDNKISKEIHYICTPVINIDSLLKVNKKNHPQVYLEQCKYKLKKREMIDLIDDGIILSSDDE